MSLRAHLLHGAAYRSLALVDVVALAPWGSEFFRLVAAHPTVFAALPAPLHEALVRAHVAGAAHRTLSPAHRLATLVPGAELTLIERAGHLVQLDAPEALTSALQEWLVRQGWNRPSRADQPGATTTTPPSGW